MLMIRLSYPVLPVRYTLESKNIQGIENGGVVGGGVEGPSPVL